MPLSTIKLMTDPPETGTDRRRFKRFYVCLEPLKEGFGEGCRPLIGLDGCHLRGPFGGILLTAVATDPNDGIYPVASAHVEAENNDSWDWFMSLLKTDLRIENSGFFTFISDRQKGLVNALEKQVPSSEHRFCVMHLYRNLWQGNRGIGIRKALWFAARSTTEFTFKKHMDILKQISNKAYNWLSEKPRSQWTRTGFKELCKSDMFVNNNCEVFNHAINNFREMGIITMFKSIHLSCMERIQRRKTKMEASTNVFCTKPMKKLHKAMQMAANARPVWNCGDKYSVTMTDGGHQIVVDLSQKHYAYRKWQLTGIPCFHACACIFFQKQSPVDYMHECYSKERYLQVYNHVLDPVNGEEFWEDTTELPPLPPVIKVAPGRPKKKRDTRTDIIETRPSNPYMLKRSETSLRCSHCNEWGHNQRSCKSKKVDMKKKVEEEGGIDLDLQEKLDTVNVATKKHVTCSRFQKLGHNIRGCPKKKKEKAAAAEKVREKHEEQAVRDRQHDLEKKIAEDTELAAKKAVTVKRHSTKPNPAMVAQLSHSYPQERLVLHLEVRQ
ncbi:uncharacterized protein LOC141685495 [Apium graveolens]|uniref:uncharacterized protein LOC141685495 n=1 Tax=Apium graveolens TaxID=4045 RepID=UPI003D7BFF1C